MVFITARSESSVEVVAVSSEYLHRVSIAILLPSPLLAVAVSGSYAEMPSCSSGVAEEEIITRKAVEDLCDPSKLMNYCG